MSNLLDLPCDLLCHVVSFVHGTDFPILTTQVAHTLSQFEPTNGQVQQWFQSKLDQDIIRLNEKEKKKTYQMKVAVQVQVLEDEILFHHQFQRLDDDHDDATSTTSTTNDCQGITFYTYDQAMESLKLIMLPFSNETSFPWSHQNFFTCSLKMKHQVFVDLMKYSKQLEICMENIFDEALKAQQLISSKQMQQDFLDKKNQVILKKNTCQQRELLLILASAWGHEEILRQLIFQYQMDPSIYRDICLRSAAEFGHTKVVQELIQFPQVYAIGGWEFAIGPLALGAQNGHVGVVQTLLEDPRASFSLDSCAFFYACYGKHEEIVRLFLNDPRANARDIDKNGYAVSAVLGHWGWMRVLVKKYALAKYEEKKQTLVEVMSKNKQVTTVVATTTALVAAAAIWMSGTN